VSAGKFYTSSVATANEYTGQSTNWSYSNNTLTLTDFVWETSAEAALQIVGSCTLYVQGTNTFTSTFSGSSYFSYGILTANSLTISGDKNGILNATGGNTTGGSSRSYGISANGLSGSTVSIAISGGTVNATGGNTTANTSDSYGISANGSTVSIAISGGTVNATGGNTTANASNSYGIEAGSGSNITISGGIVNATGGTVGSGSSYGIATGSGSNITISGRTVVAKGHTRAIHQNLGTLTFPASRAYNWISSTNYDGSGATTGTNPPDAYAYSDQDKYIKIAPVPKTFRGNIIVRGGASLIIGKP